MSQSAKAVFALVVIVCMVGSAVSWIDGQFHVVADIGFPAGFVVAIVILLWSLTRQDKAPDFLAQVAGGSQNYFERNGLCFAIMPTTVEGCCVLDVYFQNRYERPCKAWIAFQPSVGFLVRRKIDVLAFQFDCEGGEFGVAHVPWAIPEKYQGKSQSLDVGASVSYPQRRGKMLRFRDGVNVGKLSGGLFTASLTLVAATAGGLVLTKPARVKIMLPECVTESLPDEVPVSVETLWRPGTGVGDVDFKGAI